MHDTPTSTETTLDTVPDPVRRYLQRAVPDGTPPVERAELTQRGAFRLGGPDARWRPLKASQTVTTDPPGFRWEGRIRLLPLVWARATDAYHEGEGSLRATLFSVIPLARADATPEMDAAELQRYLAEAVLYPTALFPSDRLTWEPLTDDSARATLTDGDTTVSLDFQFGDDLVVGVSGQRFHLDESTWLPWHGTFDAYERRDGLFVPTEGEVAWTLPEGECPYWRATFDAATYEFADA